MWKSYWDASKMMFPLSFFAGFSPTKMKHSTWFGIEITWIIQRLNASILLICTIFDNASILTGNEHFIMCFYSILFIYMHTETHWTDTAFQGYFPVDWQKLLCCQKYKLQRAFFPAIPSTWHFSFWMWTWACQFKTVKWFSSVVFFLSYFRFVSFSAITLTYKSKNRNSNAVCCCCSCWWYEIWPLFCAFETYHVSSGTEAHQRNHIQFAWINWSRHIRGKKEKNIFRRQSHPI